MCDVCGALKCVRACMRVVHLLVRACMYACGASRSVCVRVCVWCIP